MASMDETRQALLNAIHQMATEAGADDSGVAALTAYGAAAKDMAEAYAWLTTPGHSH
jgi:hypothetical protein